MTSPGIALPGLAATRLQDAAVGLAAAFVVMLALPATRSLGPLAGTMTLVLVLPPMAHALVRLGWAEWLATWLDRARGRVLLPFAAWLGLSALLTLDVAAVVAAPVGSSLASRTGRGRRTQLGVAIVGANAGSLLFPFSNLTNLLVVAGTGLGFGAYVAQALPAQAAVVIVAGALLVRLSAADRAPRGVAVTPCVARPTPDSPGGLARLGGTVAVVGAVMAIVTGFAGGDVAIPFTLVSATLVGLAVGGRRAALVETASSVPIAGVAVVLVAAVARGPAAEIASSLPGPLSIAPGPAGLLVACLVGGLLAAAFNNLPAAAFGAVWLIGDPASAIVAYLVGTNVVALATPHGSLATILARSIAARGGHPVATRSYLKAAWPFALVPAAVAVLVLAVIH